MTLTPRRTPMRFHRVLCAGLLVLSLAACGDDTGDETGDDPGEDIRSDATSPGDPTSGGTGSTGSTGTSDRYAYPTGPDDVVLRIETGGGFVPYDYVLTAQPDVLLLGDGRLLTPAPGAVSTSQFVPMLEGRLDVDAVQELLAAADEAGLLAAAPDYELPDGLGIADAPTTTVTVAVGGKHYDHSAYALGLAAGSGSDETPERDRLRTFVDAAEALAGSTATGPFDPDQVRVQVTPQAGGGTVVPWTVDGLDLAAVGECAIVDGAVADAVADVLGGLDSPTQFRQGDQQWQVLGTLVLPGSDTTCGAPS